MILWELRPLGLQKEFSISNGGPLTTEENPLIRKLLALPSDQMLSPKDLVQLGIGRSETRLYHMRLRGEGAKYLRIPKRTILYAPADVISWFRSCQCAPLPSQS